MPDQGRAVSATSYVLRGSQMPEAMDVYKVGCCGIQNTKNCSNALVGEAPVPELQSAEDRTPNASVSKAKWLQAHRAESLLLLPIS